MSKTLEEYVVQFLTQIDRVYTFEDGKEHRAVEITSKGLTTHRRVSDALKGMRELTQGDKNVG